MLSADLLYFPSSGFSLPGDINRVAEGAARQFKTRILKIKMPVTLSLRVSLEGSVADLVHDGARCVTVPRVQPHHVITAPIETWPLPLQP